MAEATIKAILVVVLGGGDIRLLGSRVRCTTIDRVSPICATTILTQGGLECGCGPSGGVCTGAYRVD